MKRTVHLLKAILSDKEEATLRRFVLESKNKDKMERIASNVVYKDIHRGKRCFIIGNGPSIRSVDLSLLSEEYTVTVNQMPRNKAFEKIHTQYHLWADERFFSLQRDNAEDMELLDVMRSVNTENNHPTVFYKADAMKMIDEFQLDKELNIEYYMDGRMGDGLPLNDYPLNRPLPLFSTCVHYAIMIAIYMGFSEIYLLGCDCTSILNTINARVADATSFEYAYDITENEKRRMVRINTQSSLADEFEWYGILLETYGQLFKYAQQHGCKLFNATDGSIIENVPKVKLLEVLMK